MNKILLLIIISGFCGGSVYPLIKIANAYDIPKFSYLFWESLLVITLVTALSIVKKESFLPNRSEGKYYLFCALTNILIPQSLFFIIAANMPVTVTSLITALTPLCVYVVTISFLNKEFCKYKILGLVLGVSGVFILLISSLFDEFSNISWHWLLVSFLLPIIYTINRIFVTNLQPHETNPFKLTIGLFTFVALGSGLLMIASNTLYIPFHDYNIGDYALLSHAFLMAIFYISFFIIAKTGAVQNSLTFYLAPLVASMWGIFLFKEEIEMSFILAAVLIFLGLYMVTKKRITNN